MEEYVREELQNLERAANALMKIGREILMKNNLLSNKGLFKRALDELNKHFINIEANDNNRKEEIAAEFKKVMGIFDAFEEDERLKTDEDIVAMRKTFIFVKDLSEGVPVSGGGGGGSATSSGDSTFTQYLSERKIKEMMENYEARGPRQAAVQSGKRLQKTFGGEDNMQLDNESEGESENGDADFVPDVGEESSESEDMDDKMEAGMMAAFVDLAL